MSAQSTENHLDEHAVVIRKDNFLHAWISPAAKKSHARTAKQVKLLGSLFSVLGDAFTRSGLRLNRTSELQRIENAEFPELAFWICRPRAKGPTYMLVVRRSDETRAWQPELEQALAAK